jgi:hypothetical protein
MMQKFTFIFGMFAILTCCALLMNIDPAYAQSFTLDLEGAAESDGSVSARLFFPTYSHGSATNTSEYSVDFFGYVPHFFHHGTDIPKSL